MNTLTNLAAAWTHIQYENLKDFFYKKTNETTEDIITLAKIIEKDGIAILPNYYSTEKCDELIAEIEGLLSEGQANVWKDEAGSDTRIYGSHLYSERIRQFYEDPFLKEIGEQYLKSELINSHTLAAKLIPKENNLGSGGGWHRDSVYKRQYKSILYLTDVNHDNGPFEFILRTHHKSTIYKSIKHCGFSAHQNRISNKQIDLFTQKYPQFEKCISTAPRGTVVLVDTGAIHRGMPILEGNRYALTNYFYPKHHYTNSQRKKFESLF